MLTIIGLGPADAGGLSLNALKALRSSERLILRTGKHPAAEDLRGEGIEFETLDSYYESAPDFPSLYRRIADYILGRAAEGDVSYAVPGHPLVAEESVRLILECARQQELSFRVLGSESFLEPTLASIGIPLGAGLVLKDALSLETWKPRPEFPLLLFQVYDADTASAVKLRLMERYPDDHAVTVVRAAGVPEMESVETIPLHRLDRIPVDHLTSVYVPAVPEEDRKKTFEDLVGVMARLRGPGGCPWDREQNHSTLKRYLLEEAYEVLDAIDSSDMDELAEELGDLLLQVVFHAQLEAEVGTFDIDDVIGHIVDKLIRRHPHVFGDLAVKDADEVLRNWEIIKKEEKDSGWRDSALDGVPNSLPALMRAMEISKRAVKVGFEWEKFEDVLAKLREEVSELEEALQSGDQEQISAELGDLLFTVVNVARWNKVDPEDALRTMLNRFSTRFRYIEQEARSQRRALEEMSLAEMDALWEAAKQIPM